MPVSLAALYGKIKRTEPEVVATLVRGSVERLARMLANLHRHHWRIEALFQCLEALNSGVLPRNAAGTGG